MSTQKVWSRRVSRSNVMTVTSQGPGVDPYVEENKSSVTWTDTVTYGDNLPDWKQRLKEGSDATTGLGVNGRVLEVFPGHMIVRRKLPTVVATNTVTAEQHGDFNISSGFNSNNPNDISVDVANARALGKFVQRARSARTTFQGGVFLGELAQTIHGIRNPAKGLREALDAYWHKANRLRSTSGFRIQRIPLEKNFAELWLETQFHVRPLVNDLKEGHATAARFLLKSEQQPHSVSVRGSDTVRVNSANSTAGRTNGQLKWREVETSYDESVVIYRGAVRVTGLYAGGASERLGFDPGNWAPTIYELLPYSFLVDYFTNVGEIVTGLSFPRSALMWSNRTIVRSSVVERTAYVPRSFYDNANAFRLSSFSAPKVVTRKRVISRAGYTGTLVPALTLEVPGSGSLKWLNMAALGILKAHDSSYSWL